MATFLIPSSSSSVAVPISSAKCDSRNRELGSGVGFPKTSFPCGTKLFSAPSPALLNSRRFTSRRCLKFLCSSSLDHIPKNVGEENLKGGWIIFQDITTLLLDPKAFKDTIDLFVERYRGKEISVVAGIEARGFIFGPPIALAIGAKFVPMRKPNRLPGEVIAEEYSLEYGTDKMEMHVGAVQAGEHALVIDDLIATGGTLCAAIRLLERVGVEVVECACVIELPELKGRNRLGDKPLFVLVNAV